MCSQSPPWWVYFQHQHKDIEMEENLVPKDMGKRLDATKQIALAFKKRQPGSRSLGKRKAQPKDTLDPQERGKGSTRLAKLPLTKLPQSKCNLINVCIRSCHVFVVSFSSSLSTYALVKHSAHQLQYSSLNHAMKWNNVQCKSFKIIVSRMTKCSS